MNIALAQNFLGKILEKSMNIDQEGRMMGWTQTGVAVPEVVIPIEILIDHSPGVPMVILGMMTTLDMTSMQMRKKEIIRGYLHVLAGILGVVLILIIVGQETICEMWTNILEINMIVQGIKEIRIHHLKELELAGDMHIMKKLKGTLI